MRTVVLLSGGLDSATVLAACVADGDDCLTIGFDYSQSHRIELRAARVISERYSVPFEVLPVPGMPKIDDVVFAGRNLVFASIGIAVAQARKFDRVAVGCNSSDWERFADCRPPFWRAIEVVASTYGVIVIAPLIYMSKRDVVERARTLGVPIDLTWSCYYPKDDAPCGKCLACKTRQEALK